MSEDKQLIISWVKFGVAAGIAADLCYGLAISVPMPRMLSNIVFWSFGPLLIAGTPGTFYFIKHHRNSIALQVGCLFLMLAGLTVTMMAVVQRSVFETFSAIRPDRTDAPACLRLGCSESGTFWCRAFEEDSLRISPARIQAIGRSGSGIGEWSGHESCLG